MGSGVDGGPASSRRAVLKLGLVGAVAAIGAAAGVEIDRSVADARLVREETAAGCPTGSVAPGPHRVGSFFSRYRRRRVSYTLAYPPGYGPGDQLPLLLYLHAWLGNHTSMYAEHSLADALALRPDGRPLRPFAMICPDGGQLYWHAHPGDDPQGMLVNELIPMCRRWGLGDPAHGHAVIATGISMGGYGALLLAEQYPSLIDDLAVISPAIWSTWDLAHMNNPVAFTSPADYAEHDVITHAGALAGKPVRVASGLSDRFHPGVEVLASALPHSAEMVFAPGGHDRPFFRSQAGPSLRFLSDHLPDPPASC